MVLLNFTITGGEVTPQIQMLSTATVLQMKQRIEMILGVPILRQTLKHRSMELRNDETFEYYGLFGGTGAGMVAAGTSSASSNANYDVQLTVAPLPGDPKFPILVVRSPNAESHALPVNVRETYTVADLRRKLERRMGIFGSELTLFRLYQLMDQPFLPLSRYFVCAGCTIKVVVAIDGR
ncbi:hypothetical protein Tsubulata_009995 [Turnera subulata]|uniref:Ubiquitin-like domain-containing protein n=1 Tax=Turnera subulata TaxID=218843 RepID=A0A9Q0G5W3_9ROSI|nr:hypothetical protein Tsubulata_009995 [Turnera subulata]